MIPKRFYLLFLVLLVILSLLTYNRSLITPQPLAVAEDPKTDTLRKIFQLRHNSQEAFATTSKYHPQYVPPNNNQTGNVPDVYLNPKLKRPTGMNRTCAKFPDFFDLKFKNNHWQLQKTTNGTLHLFNAYLDQRNDSLVRIVATYDVHKTQETFYCQFWYGTSSRPKVVPSEVPFWMFHLNWGADGQYFNHPYLITCPVIREHGRFPVSVSLVDKSCANASNNLKIIYKDVKEKKNFVVCVKGLSFPFEDRSTRLAEWIELVNLLGAEKINFYEFSVHPNTQKLLDYYVNRGLVEVTSLTLVGDFSNHPLLQKEFLKKKITPRRLQEVIPFNDCFYKHLNEFKYVVLLDTDEVIVPKQNTWVELIETMLERKPNASSYMARNIYFFDTHLHQHDWFNDIPKHMHMLQHVYRAHNHTKPGYFVKGFHDTDRVMALHNHFPFKCLTGCTNKEIDLDLAQLQHYRADCTSGVSDCKSMKADSVVDSRVWNFKDELIKRVDRTFREVGLDYSDFSNR